MHAIVPKGMRDENPDRRNPGYWKIEDQYSIGRKALEAWNIMHVIFWGDPQDHLMFDSTNKQQHSGSKTTLVARSFWGKRAVCNSDMQGIATGRTTWVLVLFRR